MTNLELADQIEALAKAATPGKWEEDYDPFDGQDYATCVILPDQAGQPGTQIARFDHNWKEAMAGERRISWKEAETNAALIVELRNNADTLVAALREVERLREALDEDALEDAISDSLDIDWIPHYAVRLIRQRAGLKGDDQ